MNEDHNVAPTALINWVITIIFYHNIAPLVLKFKIICFKPR